MLLSLMLLRMLQLLLSSLAGQRIADFLDR
jgi:hypothetical protein